MTGRHDVKRVTIDPGVLSDDKEMLEDLVAAAVNDAVRRVESATQAKNGERDLGPSFAARHEVSILKASRAPEPPGVRRAPLRTPP